MEMENEKLGLEIKSYIGYSPISIIHLLFSNP
jgi:hypothetical protein